VWVTTERRQLVTLARAQDGAIDEAVRVVVLSVAAVIVTVAVVIVSGLPIRLRLESLCVPAQADVRLPRG
jgi:hypothetical protein